MTLVRPDTASYHWSHLPVVVNPPSGKRLLRRFSGRCAVLQENHCVRIPRSLGHVVTVAVATTVLAGCAGSNLQAPPLNGGTSAGHALVDGANRTFSTKQVKSWMGLLDAVAPLTYVSDYQNNNVTVFNRKGKVLGQIGGLNAPDGLFVDENHNLWVANIFGSNVLEYARGGTTPILTLNDPGRPTDVTICPNGRVYVSNGSNPGSAPGNIEVYGPGQINPGGSLSWPNEHYFAYITCDKAGNVFTTVSNGGSDARVIEFPKGDSFGAHDLGITLSYAGGIKPDIAGNLLIVDPINYKIIEYTEAGSPTGTSISTGASVVFDIALSKDNRTIGAADGTSANPYGVSWTYPGGVPGRTYRAPGARQAAGFAFDPPFDPRL
jgi:hypothetical protein